MSGASKKNSVHLNAHGKTNGVAIKYPRWAATGGKYTNAHSHCACAACIAARMAAVSSVIPSPFAPYDLTLTESFMLQAAFEPIDGANCAEAQSGAARQRIEISAALLIVTLLGNASCARHVVARLGINSADVMQFLRQL